MDSGQTLAACGHTARPLRPRERTRPPIGAEATSGGYYAYRMSKAALNMQSRILHNYLKPRGFRVLAVHPGWMRTNMGGPAASISPDESAAGIFQLARREWNADDPIYMDYVGQPLPW